jgi:histidine triad (HIT) family protein
MTIFEKIASREIPAKLIHEDDDLFAFHDVNPQAPVHVLIVPKKAIARIDKSAISDQPLLGKLLYTAQSLAHSLGIAESGFRIVINNGPAAGESVPHLHVHLLGGRTLAWPPG